MTLTAGEVDVLRSDTETTMHDRCVLVRNVPSVGTERRDAYGDPEVTPTADVPVEDATICGFRWFTADEMSRLSGLHTGGAEFRLPSETSLVNLRCIRLTHKAGTPYGAPIEFRIVGKAQFGLAAVVVNAELTREVSP